VREHDDDVGKIEDCDDDPPDEPPDEPEGNAGVDDEPEYLITANPTNFITRFDD
jgi:hypothetical protein